jgi:methylglutaconyl-CoA hydratase
MSDDVRYTVSGQVATITLDRPSTRNALNLAVVDGLAAGLAGAVADPAVRVVVLAAEGPAFCSGADLSAVAELAGGDASVPRRLADLLESMMTAPKPVVGRIQGHVVGGGWGLVAACDVAIASRAARFRLSEVRVGAAPAVVAMPILAKIGRTKAAEWMLTAATISADDVAAAGLVSAAVEPDDLDDSVAAMCAELVAGAPTALAATKALIWWVPDQTRAEAWAWTAALSARLFGSAESAEGRAAFAARRDPDWSAFPTPSVFDDDGDT